MNDTAWPKKPMFRRPVPGLLAVALMSVAGLRAESGFFTVNQSPTIVVADGESDLIRFARTELAQCIKSQIGVEPIVVGAGKADAAALRKSDVILLGTAGRHARLKQLLSEGWLKPPPTNAQAYTLRVGLSRFDSGGKHWLAALAGADDLGTMYAVRDFCHYHLRQEDGKAVLREAQVQTAPKIPARVLSESGVCLFSPTLRPADRDKLREMIARGESLVFDKQYYVDWLSEWKVTHLNMTWCNTSAHRKAWKDFVDYAHSRGIKIIRCLVPYRPLHEFPPPEIGSLDRPTKTADCPRDPRIREWYLQRLRQMITEEPLDGIKIEAPYHDGCYCQCERCKNNPLPELELVEPFLRLARATRPDLPVWRVLKAPTRDASDVARYKAEMRQLGKIVDWYSNTFPEEEDQKRWLDIGPQCGTYLRLYRVALLGKNPPAEIASVFNHFRMSAERGSEFHGFSHRFYGGRFGNIREGFAVEEDAEMMRRYPGRLGPFGLALASEAAFDPFVSGEARVQKLQRIRELTIPDYPYDGDLDLAALRAASEPTKVKSASGSLVVDDPASHPSPGKWLSHLYGISDQGFVLAGTCVDYFNDGKRKLLHASRATKKLSMIEAADGRAVWSKAIPGDHQSICAVDPTGRGEFEIFYTTSAPGNLHRLDRNGNILASWTSGDWKLGNSPVLLDGDGDGRLDLYLGSRNRKFFHLGYPDLRMLGERDGWAQCGCYTSALDVDKAGRWSLFAGSGDDGRGGKGVLHRLNPSNLESVWSYRTDDNASSADPVLVDLDGDGRVEIIKSVDNYHHDDAHDAIYAFTTDGKVLWKTEGFSGEQSPNVADLDGDGKPEIVGMTFGGEVYCLDARGKVKWRRDLRPEIDDQSHAMNMAPILCDVNGDSELEIVALTGCKHFDPSKPGTNLANGIVFVLDAKGAVLDKLDIGSPRCWSVGFACNVDNDPHLELVLSGCGHLDVIRTRGFGPNTEVFQKRRTYQRNNAHPWAYEDTYFMDRGTRENVVNQTDNLVLARNADGYQRSGSFTTELLTLPPGGFFSRLDCEIAQAEGTKLVVTVLDQKDDVLMANASARQTLQLVQPVKLRFNFSTTDSRRTPKLDAYRLSFKRKTPAAAD
jgi:hypothetical protein